MIRVFQNSTFLTITWVFSEWTKSKTWNVPRPIHFSHVIIVERQATVFDHSISLSLGNVFSYPITPHISACAYSKYNQNFAEESWIIVRKCGFLTNPNFLMVSRVFSAQLAQETHIFLRKPEYFKKTRII